MHEVRKGYDDPFVMLHYSDLDVVIANCKPTTVVVWLCLLRRANHKDGMSCIPSLGRIAEDAGVSTKTVTGAITELVAIGAVTVEKRTRDDGSDTSNRYTLHRLAEESSAGGESFGTPGGYKSGTRGGYQKVHTNNMTTPEPDEGEPHSHALARVERVGDRTPKEWFDHFYRRYPRRVGEADALKAWLKLPRDETLYQEIIHAVDLLKQTTWKGKETRYIPYPATFLNGKRWLDEPEAPTAPPTKTGMSAEELFAFADELERQGY